MYALYIGYTVSEICTGSDHVNTSCASRAHGLSSCTKVSFCTTEVLYKRCHLLLAEIKIGCHHTKTVTHVHHMTLTYNTHILVNMHASGHTLYGCMVH